MIKRLIRAGVDVLRLNFSHGTPQEHLGLIRRVRKLSLDFPHPIGILADLPGPKLRTGDLVDGKPVFLDQNRKCTLTTRSVLGTSELIPVTFKGLPELVKRGDRILLADGLLELRVISSTGNDILCKVSVGGELREHQGINIPGRHIPIPAITSKDREIIHLLAKTHVDFVALSFVQRPNDIEEALSIMKRAGKILPIIAKIEKPEALKHIESILKIVDGIMVARGDLGVELPTAKIPVVQKELIHLASKKSVPVITATQMLDSMIHNPRPTRAETTDVANAIWDGTDAVMLSGETAKGNYPIEAVKTMGEIIDNAEANPNFQWTPQPCLASEDSKAVLKAASGVCQPRIHKAIVTYTETGATAISLSKLRPSVPIFALTPSETTYRKLSLIWGVRAFISPRGRTVDDMIRIGDQVLVEKAGLKREDRVIVVAGTRLASGATNLLKIHPVGETLTGDTRRRRGQKAEKRNN